MRITNMSALKIDIRKRADMTDVILKGVIEQENTNKEV
jgi:hypothetical protein